MIDGWGRRVLPLLARSRVDLLHSLARADGPSHHEGVGLAVGGEVPRAHPHLPVPAPVCGDVFRGHDHALVHVDGIMRIVGPHVEFLSVRGDHCCSDIVCGNKGGREKVGV